MGTKRFKAAVIGGSGYGGAELIRRLLVHPDVELVRVASIDFIGEPVASVHPNLEGRTDLRFEGLAPPRRPADGRRAHGPPHKVSATKAPEIMATARALWTSRRLRVAGSGGLRESTTARRTRAPRADRRDVRLRAPELHRDAIRRARYVASPGCFATTIRAGALAPRGGGAPGGGRRGRRLTG